MKKKIFLLLNLLTIILPLSFANAETKNALAKYEYVIDDSVVTSKIINGVATIQNENGKFTFIDEQNKYNKANIAIISTKEDASIWIKSVVENNYKEIVGSYYIAIIDENNKLINNISNLYVEFISNNSITKPLFNIVNIQGKTILTSNSVKNYELLSSCYFVIGEELLEKTFNIELYNGGKIVIDGNIITESGKYTTASKQIIISPNSGYEMDSIYENNIDITSMVANGFLLTKTLKNNSNIKIKFKESLKETSTDENFTIKGKLMSNGEPLRNTVVELHSEILRTVTDNDGNFKFEGVPTGKHSITIVKDEKVIGYQEFEVSKNKSDKVNFKLNNQDNTFSNKENIELSLILKDNYEMEIAFLNKDEKINNNYMLLKVVGIIAIISVVIILAFVLKNKKK